MGQNQFYVCIAHGVLILAQQSLPWMRTMKPKSNGICRSGCPTQDHASYGECLQDARIAVDKTSLKVK
jgi:hypothetical protein